MTKHQLKAASLVLVVLAVAAACTNDIGDGSQEELQFATSGEELEPCDVRNATPGAGGLNTIDYPCGIVLIQRGATVPPSDNPDTDADPGITTNVARDSKGRIYVGPRRNKVVLVWDSTGAFVASLGKGGSGPGEISYSPVGLHVDPFDTLHVRAGSGKWLVFDPELQFVRTMNISSGTPAGVTRSEIVMTTRLAGEPGDVVFHRLNRDGTVIGSFGKPRLGPRTSVTAGRRSGVGIDNDLWILPDDGSEGYVVEHWSFDGRLLGLIERDVPWLPLGGYPDMPGLPNFKSVTVDSSGLLWVVLAAKDPGWTGPVPSDPRERERASALYGDIRLEVLDPARGTVLASVRIDAPTEENFRPLFPVDGGERMVWGLTSDSLGRKTIHIAEMMLVKRR